MKKYLPTLWLSFGLVSLTLALSLTAFLFGLIPDAHRAELEARAKVAEALAVQLATAANRNDNSGLVDTMKSVVERNSDVLSIALRKADGTILVESGRHDENWVPVKAGRSTPTSVSVPLIGAHGKQGDIEISFGPATTGRFVLGFPTSILTLLAYLFTCGFVGYFFILRRTLKQLDPGRVIPERVQKAFDTLAEGVIILDEKQRILLTNHAFSELYSGAKPPAKGSKINNLGWRMVDGTAKAGGYPWHKALKEGREMREDFLSLRTPDGTIHNFNVNATIINGEDQKTIGAIVTLQDMTTFNMNAQQLAKTTDALTRTQEEVDRQKDEIEYLASHDPLTGCFNRRALYQHMENCVEKHRENMAPFSLIVADIDNFNAVNENFGPAAGDALLVGLSSILKNSLESLDCANGGLVSRYGGDEFCILVPSDAPACTQELTESIREQLNEAADKLLPGSNRLSLSFGIASLSDEISTAHQLVTRSRQALRNAKSSGRNRCVVWSETMALAPDSPRQTAGQDATHHNAGLLRSVAAIQPASTQTRGQESARLMSEDELIQAAASTSNTAFFERINHGLKRSSQQVSEHAIAQMQITSWNYLTEALGDVITKRLMRDIKRKVQAALREQDGVLLLGNTGRLMIHLAGLQKSDDVKWALKKVLDVLRQPIAIGDRNIYVSAKFGVASFPTDGQDATTLLRNSGIALNRAMKENQLQGFTAYSNDMIQSSQERLTIESGIRAALLKDEFELFFQPIVSAKTGSLSGAEALLRCHSSALSNVRIDQVIDVAEKSSLIAEIDLWVVKNALSQMQTWCDSGLKLPRISINISAKQLTNLAFMDQTYELIKNVKFSPSRVQIEVTETATMSDVEIAAPQLKRLQHLGVMIALDDFGTGQSSLTYLQRLHPDIIKIDRSFADGVNTNHANATLVSAMTVMAHCLGLKVVVEGVEDEEQLDFLRDTNCDEIQGYLISKPMPASVMTDWLELFVKEKGTAPYSDSNDSLAAIQEATKDSGPESTKAA